jgi:hypothetical protein
MIIAWPIMQKIPEHYHGGDTVIISTVARTKEPWCQLSPFVLGPCTLYEHNGIMLISKNMENAWQYAKVYEQHTQSIKRWPYTATPSAEYWKWAKEGWRNPKAVRYPMGRRAKPEFSWWNGSKLNYVNARKKIYVPLYAEAVQKTDAFKRLRSLAGTQEKILLLDYDAYDNESIGKSMTEVLNDPKKKMGHAFVLKMLLEHDEALNQCAMR